MRQKKGGHNGQREMMIGETRHTIITNICSELRQQRLRLQLLLVVVKIGERSPGQKITQMDQTSHPVTLSLAHAHKMIAVVYILMKFLL